MTVARLSVLNKTSFLNFFFSFNLQNIKVQPVRPSYHTILPFDGFKAEAVSLAGSVTSPMLHTSFIFVFRNLNRINFFCGFTTVLYMSYFLVKIVWPISEIVKKIGNISIMNCNNLYSHFFSGGVFRYLVIENF